MDHQQAEEKTLSPTYVLRFVLYCFLGLGIIVALFSFIFPKEGILLINNDHYKTDSLMSIEDLETDSIAHKENVYLRFLTFNDLLHKKESNASQPKINVIKEQILNIDSLMEGDNTEEMIADVNEEDLKKLIHQIEFPKDDHSIFNSFFKQLKSLNGTNKLIRILHYGDSQIEGDRITSFLRSKLQSKFGGSGIGLMPAKQPYDFRYSVRQNTSDNWNRYTVFGRRDTAVHHKRYGVLASFNRYAPLTNLAAYNDSINYEAFTEFNKSNLGFMCTRKWQKVRVFYSHNKKPISISIENNGAVVKKSTTAPNSSLQTLTYNFGSPVQQTKILFSGHDSPDIYGIALDGMKGIAVDNIGLRGCSGTIFTRMDKTLMKELYKQLNVEMIILQYGGNVMPYMNKEKKVEQYANWFKSQIYRMKQARPGAPILVIGPSDMANKIGDEYITYEFLPQVNNALKAVAHETGAAYWDMFSAMGGKNSMEGWVNASPSLAGNDYVHFTPKGAKVIANMFYNAFIFEYNRYVKESIKTSK